MIIPPTRAGKRLKSPLHIIGNNHIHKISYVARTRIIPDTFELNYCKLIEPKIHRPSKS